MLSIRLIKKAGYKIWEKILRKFNKLRGIKHNLSESSAEQYYLKVYKYFIKKYASELYEKGYSLKILDVGCGTGRFAVELAELGHDVTGVDYMQTALDKARGKVFNRGASIDLKCGDAETVLKNLVGNEYDVILCIEMLYGSPEYKKLMSLMRSLLSCDGVMICSHKPKFYFVSTLLRQGNYRYALKVLESKEGIVPISGRPIYYNWQTVKEVKNLYDGLEMNLLGIHSIGTFSGFGVDGMSGIVDIEGASKSEKDILFEIETKGLEDHVGIGRYMLTASVRK
jgi:2-polyprenyl-3-methyl-5-hydroxy-6-metoxy-1,4-benzoquinol methylase